MRQRGTSITAALAASILAAVLAAAVPAEADGSVGPDPTYAGDGTLELSATHSPMTVDGQDRLLVLRGTGVLTTQGAQLRRYLASGAPDPSFAAVDLPSVEASATRIIVLADGTISLVESATNDSYNRTIYRVSSSGVLDTTYGSGGQLLIGVGNIFDPFIHAPDGSVVAYGRQGNVQVIRRYGKDGKLDPTFSGDGIVEPACCAESGAPVVFRALQPDGDGGGLVAIVGNASAQALVRYRPDGTVAEERAVPVSGRAERLWAVPSGGFFLGYQNSGSPASVHLDDDLQPDGGSTDASTAYNAFTSVRVSEERSFHVTYAAAGSSAGRASITAFDASGIDRSFGVDGKLTTEPMAPPSASAGSLTARIAFSVAPDGRIAIASSFAWGGSSSTLRGQRLDAYAPDGQLLHRWESRVVMEALPAVAAEQVGAGFLVQRTVDGRGATVQRWVFPDERVVPGPVRNATATAADGQGSASWEAPAAAPGLLVTGYQVRVSEVGGDPSLATTATPTATSANLPLPTSAPLTVHRFEIRARGAGGTLGPAVEAIAIPPLPLVNAFLAQISTGFGTATTAAQRAQAIAALRAGTATPASLVRSAAQGSSASSTVDPVVRLYLAYFQRLPDPAGLRYWVGKRRTGTSVARISAVLEDSSEFKRTYGSLSNAAFVQLVYQNVLGRPGDAGGVAYWTGRLDRRATSRGHLMASFSESSEHVRRTRAKVDVVGIHWGLLGRTPTAAEVTRWAGPSPEGDAVALARTVLASAEYLARID